MLKVGVLAFISAATAFAGLANHHGEFVGRGTWVTPDGSKGTWHSDLKIEKKDAGLVISEKLTIKQQGEADHVEETTSTIAQKDSGFFDILTKDEVMGWGHCDKDLCHLSGADKAKGSFAETYAFVKGKIYRTGTHTSDKFRVVWKGQMKHKGDKEEQEEVQQQQQQVQQQQN